MTYNHVLNFAKSLDGDGQDLTQSAYEKGVRVGVLDDSFLFRVVQNEFRDVCRRANRALPLPDRTFCETRWSDIKDYFSQRLLMSLTVVGEEMQEILIHRNIYDYTYPELGKIYDVNPSTLRHRVKIAMTQVREAYESNSL